LTVIDYSLSGSCQSFIVKNGGPDGVNLTPGGGQCILDQS